MAFRQILYHIVFRTKESRKTIPRQHSEELYKYITGIIKNKNCTLLCINGAEEHVHILTDLNPVVSLADFIKDIKVSSSIWLRGNENFANFAGWGTKYCALTYSHKDKDAIGSYIKNQKEHHKKESFEDEMKRFFIEGGIETDEKWFWSDN